MTKNPTSSQRISIKDWADSDRPREKMISQGKAVLTNAELLAILTAVTRFQGDWQGQGHYYLSRYRAGA